MPPVLIMLLFDFFILVGGSFSDNICALTTQPSRGPQHHHLQMADQLHPHSKQCRPLGQPGRSFTLENRERRLQRPEKWRFPSRTPLLPGGYCPPGLLLLAPNCPSDLSTDRKRQLISKSLPQRPWLSQEYRFPPPRSLAQPAPILQRLSRSLQWPLSDPL